MESLGRGARISAWLVVLGLPAWTVVQAQEPGTTFRSAVDVIAVDVQVVDGSGTPVAGLGPEDFEVSIAGDPRRVISVDYIESSPIDDRPIELTPGPAARNMMPLSPDAGPGRTFMLAFDVGSLSLADARQMARAALAFADRLQPNDLVGMYSFPVGVSLEPTYDRSILAVALDRVVGSSDQNMPSMFNLSWSEIVDINAEGRGGLGGMLELVAERECPDEAVDCIAEIEAEARSMGRYLEARSRQSLNGLRDLIRLLGQSPGRQTLVLFSAGIPTSDRAGAGPDVGDLPLLIGQDAAATNTTIYTVYSDESVFQSVSADRRDAVGSLAGIGRDFEIGSQAMAMFAGSSGGAFLRVLSGSGELALERVLRETSSHYLIGVEPLPSDRDGDLRGLDVDVDLDDVTVRSRSWVAIPDR